MYYRLLIILTILTLPAFGQEIEKVIFTSQQADEPPTKQGRPEFTIEFSGQVTGGLIMSEYYENKKRKKIKDNLAIDKESVEKIIAWGELNKRSFTQSDLGIDMTILKSRATSYKLNFELPDNLNVNVDSFQFCQIYKMTRSVSTGGETIRVILKYKGRLNQEFIFDSSDIGEGGFNLKDYILCCTLLTDKIPKEVPGSDFFSKSKLTDIVLYYQKTIECEGYYYKEFTDKNPNMTSNEKRMFKDWNFAKYMEIRNKKD